MAKVTLSLGFPRHKITWDPTWALVDRDLGTPDPPFTAGFLDLYARVTEMIRDSDRAWTRDETRVIEYLISSFFREYRNWSSSGPVRDHLEKLHRKFHRLAALDLMAHAYLHMAYDLPRSIVGALDRFNVPPAEPTMRARFLELEPRFELVADEVAGARPILGRLAWINKVMPRQWKLSYIFAMWVLRIRSNAYLVAETLHEMDQLDPLLRPACEARLWNGVRDRQESVARARWSPLFWFRALGMPTIMWLVVTPERWALSAAVVLVICLVAWVLNSLAVYAELAYKADKLGAATLDALVQAVLHPSSEEGAPARA